MTVKEKDFIKLLYNWYSINGRNFPWRVAKPKLYDTLIMEILLWRTKAETVNKFYYSFFNTFPNIESIKNTDIISLQKWLKPLGLYNRRSTLLKKIAESDFNVSVVTENNIRKKFGVGQYISRALMAFFFDIKIIPMDENIRRLLLRVFDFKISNVRKISKEEDIFLNKLLNNIPDQKKLIWGLIDYSFEICKKIKPACNDCVFLHMCKFSKK